MRDVHYWAGYTRHFRPPSGADPKLTDAVLRYRRHSALYKAFSELGRVQRTIFLLTYMIEPALQQHIRAETTKVEAYHHFTDWLAFGSPVLRSGDQVEQEN